MIDLSGAASADPRDVELVDRKLCEGFGCGQYFYRPRPALAKEGERLCQRCKVRELQSRLAATAQSGKTRGLNTRGHAEEVLGTSAIIH